MIFDMTRRVSGGGGPTSSDAILTVTVPTGSTVTMTKGGVTLTSMMWVKAADNTHDIALFFISQTLFDSINAWTINAAKNGDTGSATIIIDDNIEYEVSIEYLTYIYLLSLGICDLATNSSLWSKTQSSTSLENAVFSNSGLLLSIDDARGDWTYRIAVQYAPNNTITKLDFTNISTVRIYVDSVSTTGQGVRGCIAISDTLLQGVSSSESHLYAFIRGAVCDIAADPSQGFVDIDVSSYTGQQYFYVGLASGVNQLPSQTFSNSLRGTGTMNVTAIGYK